MNRIGAVIIFSSYSEEHGVPVKSAIEIIANTDTGKFGPHYIGITKSSVWKLYKKPRMEWETDSLPAILPPDRKIHGLLVMKGNEYETRRIDVAFPVLHDKCGGGEDGVTQGLFASPDIPHVGCDI